MMLTQSKSMWKITITIVITPVKTTCPRILVTQVALLALANLHVVIMYFKCIHHISPSKHPQRIPRRAWRNAYLSNHTDTNRNAIIYLNATDVSQSYAEATIPHSINLWASLGVRKIVSVKHYTFTLLESNPCINVLPCRSIFKVNSGTPKDINFSKSFITRMGWTIMKRLSQSLAL